MSGLGFRPTRVAHGGTFSRHTGVSVPTAVTSPLRPAAAGSLRLRQAQTRRPQQIVSPCDPVAPRLRPFFSPRPAASQAAYRLDPPKDFLHLLAKLLADPVTTFGGRVPARPSPARSRRPCTPHGARLRLSGERPCRPRRFCPTHPHAVLDGPDLTRHPHRLRFADRIMDRKARTQALAGFPSKCARQNTAGFFDPDLPILLAFQIGPAPVGAVGTELLFVCQPCWRYRSSTSAKTN